MLFLVHEQMDKDDYIGWRSLFRQEDLHQRILPQQPGGDL